MAFENMQKRKRLDVSFTGRSRRGCMGRKTYIASRFPERDNGGRLRNADFYSNNLYFV